MLAVATLVFAYNVIRSRRMGERAGNDPWGAPTLEWSLHSPPPEYNYAVIPTVRSRYPLWDLRAEHRSAHEPDRPPPTARELGIPMPTPTVKPLIASIGLTTIFVGLIWNKSLPIMLGGTALFVVALYAWLLSPLEEHEE